MEVFSKILVRLWNDIKNNENNVNKAIHMNTIEYVQYMCTY